jgi:hypothetical protein
VGGGGQNSLAFGLAEVLRKLMWKFDEPYPSPNSAERK